MRDIEEKIIQTINSMLNAENGTEKTLSIRDKVRKENDIIIYSLWNTDLFSIRILTGEKRFQASNHMDMSYKFYHGYAPRRDFIISNTTKSRLNALLYEFSKNQLEVHSSIKDWSVKFNGEKIKLNRWYKIVSTYNKDHYKTELEEVKNA